MTTTDSDKALIGLAAKAAGIELYRWSQMYATYESSIGMFNPLLNNGDAFGLMARLNMQVECSRGYQRASVYGSSELFREDVYHHCDDKCAAVRRAIVRAAANLSTKEDT